MNIAFFGSSLVSAYWNGAATYYRGPLGFSRDDAARYTSEGPLGKLCDQYSLKVVWREVAAVIDARPDLLTTTKQDRQNRKVDRARRCEEFARQANQMVCAGDRVGAYTALGEGERVDPDHWVAGRYSWSDLRRIVAKAT
jgi:hypothetical protein